LSFREAATSDARVGDYEVSRSQSKDSRTYTKVRELAQSPTPVWVRGRVKSIRAKGNLCFLVLREMGDASTTAQACYFKDKGNADESKAMLKWLGHLTVESVVDVFGTAVEATVKSCSQKDVELQISKLFVVTRAPAQLPFLVEDAGRSERDIEASRDSERPLAGVGQDARLDSRWLDLRTPATSAIFKIRAAICRSFRRSLDDRGFLEIHSPKLIAGESESGAGVFTTDYFGRTACLAQSPQLYKQMAIAGDLDRVYEIAPVFRAEKSNTKRHLCEFTGLDFEMGIAENYVETVRLAYAVFKEIFQDLETKYAKELALVRDQFPSEPPVIADEPVVLSFAEVVTMLREDFEEKSKKEESTEATTTEEEKGGALCFPEKLEDLTTKQEIQLGALVKERYGTDFYVVDRYPTSARPFYTMPAADDPLVSNSYDFFLRGQEICSGAQRVHDVALLKEQLMAKGIDPSDCSESLASYLAAFSHGAPPHAGCGFGLDRVLFLYLNLPNIRGASLFPRDPSRLAP